MPAKNQVHNAHVRGPKRRLRHHRKWRACRHALEIPSTDTTSAAQDGTGLPCTECRCDVAANALARAQSPRATLAGEVTPRVRLAETRVGGAPHRPEADYRAMTTFNRTCLAYVPGEHASPEGWAPRDTSFRKAEPLGSWRRSRRLARKSGQEAASLSSSGGVVSHPIGILECSGSLADMEKSDCQCYPCQWQPYSRAGREPNRILGSVLEGGHREYAQAACRV
jgi:hypothetical protein